MGFKKDLGNGFSVREIDRDELGRIQDLHYERMFSNRHAAEIPGKPSAVDSEKISQRRQLQQKWTLCLGLYKDNTPIGWHSGHASDPETYYMQNSVVIEEHQNQKLYTRMLEVVLEITQREGFQVVTSIHHPNNAAVLIPKLKAGFIITSSQFHERFRYVIELKYFFNSERRRAYGQALGLDLK